MVLLNRLGPLHRVFNQRKGSLQKKITLSPIDTIANRSPHRSFFPFPQLLENPRSSKEVTLTGAQEQSSTEDDPTLGTELFANRSN